MQRLDAATVEVPEQNQSGSFTAQLLLHLMQSSCIPASFLSAARGGLLPVQIAAIESDAAGSSSAFAVAAFSGSSAPSSASRLSALRSLPETRVKLITTGTLPLCIFSTPPPSTGAAGGRSASAPQGAPPGLGRGWWLLPCAAPGSFHLPSSPPASTGTRSGSYSPSVTGKIRKRWRAALWFQAGVSLSAGRCRQEWRLERIVAQP